MKRFVAMLAALALALAGTGLAGAQIKQLPRKGAYALGMKEGKGKPLTVHPDGQTKVQVDRLKGPGGKELAKLTNGPCETVGCYSFSRDGRLLAVGIRYDSVRGNKGGDGTIRGYLRVYDATTGALRWDSGAREIGPVEHVAFSEKGDVILYQAGKYQEVGGP
jgi:hypothetical protein